MPNNRLKSKPIMLYVSENEKDIFKKHAHKAHSSMSMWIKNAALSYINNTMHAPVEDTALVDQLKSQIVEFKSQIAQLKAPITQGAPDKMSELIFDHIKSVGSWVTEQELHNIFNIENEEQHTDFTISMHQLQVHHSTELEYSAKYGWKCSK